MTNAPRPTAAAPKKLTAREHAAQLRAQEARRQRRSRLVRIASITAGILLAALLTTLLVSTALTSPSTDPTNSSSKDGTSLVGQQAPDFSMHNTAGQTVSLADFHNKRSVILYFNEGAGCQACLTQLTAIEQKQADFAKAGFVVLPIVMNTKAEILSEASTYNVRTPFLLDDGTASQAYDVLGKGMHENLPGHSFIVIDKTGVVRWSGDYPSMWLDPATLLSTATGAVQ